MSDLIVIKIGGRSVESENTVLQLADDIKELMMNQKVILVHGGGAFVSSVQEKYGIKPVFQDGLRMTSPDEMDIVDMGLAGRMNKYLVRLFNHSGLDAVGISGSDGQLLVAESLGEFQGLKNHTGRVKDVNPFLLKILSTNGFFPVVSPVSTDEEGHGININADEAAFSLASALKAGELIFLTDIQGVKIQGKTVGELNSESVEKAISEGEIAGGMIPKTRSSLESLKAGVGQVIIGQFSGSGDLIKLSRNETGTRIVL